MKIVFLFFLLIGFFFGCTQEHDDFNRHPAFIHYSKHAKCRMKCRHVDQSEVKEILLSGKINYSKSDLNEDSCHKRYALEGVSHDQQELRIIIAECGNTATIITVIDLGREWPCSCD